MSDPLALNLVPLNTEPSLVFDAFDLDLVLKVLSNTAFSPFFTFFIPVLFLSQGQTLDVGPVFWSSTWFAVVTALWIVQVSSVAWRNGLKPERVSWEDQIVLITGGASGIGELLANTLAVRNVTVVVLDVKIPTFDNNNIMFYKCDVSRWDEVETVSKRILNEIGHPTIIVNNAGVVQGKTIIGLEEADVRQTLGVNTLAHFWTLKAFLPAMIKEKTGHVVSISSVMGFVGAARLTDYVASKFALVGLHESLRYELDTVYKTPRIRTTLVAPGYIQTPMFSHSGYASPEPNTPIPTWLFRFLAPQLAPHDVIKRIIAALDLHQSQNIMMPLYTNSALFMRLLPSWARDFMQWVSGSNRFMEGFVKISGRREDEKLSRGTPQKFDKRAE